MFKTPFFAVNIHRGFLKPVARELKTQHLTPKAYVIDLIIKDLKGRGLSQEEINNLIDDDDDNVVDS